MRSPVLRRGDAVAEPLARARVRDRLGRELELGSFWADGPALLIFLRRFGCLCCSEQVTELAARLPEFERLGLRVVLIGSAEPEQIERFVERFALHQKPLEIVTDPSLVAFRAAGLLRSARATYGPRALWESIRATGAGHLNRLGEGDWIQQGGVLLVDGDGRVAWYDHSTSKGGHPPAVEVVDAALGLALARAPLQV